MNKLEIILSLGLSLSLSFNNGALGGTAFSSGAAYEADDYEEAGDYGYEGDNTVICALHIPAPGEANYYQEKTIPIADYVSYEDVYEACSQVFGVPREQLDFNIALFNRSSITGNIMRGGSQERALEETLDANLDIVYLYFKHTVAGKAAKEAYLAMEAIGSIEMANRWSRDRSDWIEAVIQAVRDRERRETL